MIIPWPKSQQQKNEIIQKAKLIDKARQNLTIALNATKTIVQNIFFE